MADTKPPTKGKAPAPKKPGSKPAPKGIKGKLNHEAGIGPLKLPLWGWGAVAIGAYWLWFHVIQPYNAAQADSLDTAGPGTGPVGGGSNAGGGGSIGGGGGGQTHHHGGHKHRHAHDKPHHHRRQVPDPHPRRQHANVRHAPRGART